MPTIKPLGLEAASLRSKELLRLAESRLGQSSNMLRTMAHSPAILDAYFGFNRAFEETQMPARLRCLISTAIAQAARSEYILSIAVPIGRLEGVSVEDLEAARHGYARDPKETLALQFVTRIVEQRGAIDPDLVAGLREAGYSEKEIVEIIGAVGLNLFRNYFSLIVQPDVDLPVVRLLEPLPRAAHGQ